MPNEDLRTLGVERLRREIVRWASALVFAEAAARRHCVERLRMAVVELVLREEGDGRLVAALSGALAEPEPFGVALQGLSSPASAFIGQGLGVVVLDDPETGPVALLEPCCSQCGMLLAEVKEVDGRHGFTCVHCDDQDEETSV